jgi:hypothetical protein
MRALALRHHRRRELPRPLLRPPRCSTGHNYVTDTQLPEPIGVQRWPRRKPSATFVPSSPAIVVDAGLFSLDFLYVPPVTDRPRHTYYRRSRRIRHNQCREIVDSRGSLLLTNGPWRESVHSRRGSPDFIVCEPVSRRYQGIASPATSAISRSWAPSCSMVVMVA